MSEVYLVAGTRRTLHRATRTDTGALATLEQDNIDATAKRELYTELEVGRRASRRSCARCFPFRPESNGGNPMSDDREDVAEPLAEMHGEDDDATAEENPPGLDEDLAIDEQDVEDA